MQPIQQGIYSKQDIINVLHMKTGSRAVKFRYDRLDLNERKLGEINTMESAEISMNAENVIKRTARFRLRDEGNINWLSDRIQPFFMLKMPDGEWIEWSLGIFLLSSPKRSNKAKFIYRDVEAFDGIQVLVDDKFDYRLYIAKGQNYIDSVKSILTGAGITKTNLQSCSDVLTVDREWEPGTDKITVINDLLKDINYTQLWVNEWGYYTAMRYITPMQRTIEYTYSDNQLSVLSPEAEEDLDLFNVPNKWTITASNAEDVPLTGKYTNSNANSPTSTVNRGRTILKYDTIDYVSNQEALDGYVEKVAFQDSQIYGGFTVSTALMPFHSFADVLQINYSPLSISAKYEEVRWTMNLSNGGTHKHELQRVVNI